LYIFLGFQFPLEMFIKYYDIILFGG
jgi:hypothetical protein